MTLTALGSCHVTSSRQGVNDLKERSIFFHEIYMVASYYQVLAADIKSLLISALTSLETRVQVPIFVIC